MRVVSIATAITALTFAVLTAAGSPPAAVTPHVVRPRLEGTWECVSFVAKGRHLGGTGVWIFDDGTVYNGDRGNGAGRKPYREEPSASPRLVQIGAYRYIFTIRGDVLTLRANCESAAYPKSFAELRPDAIQYTFRRGRK
jgi:hypothetical protein